MRSKQSDTLIMRLWDVPSAGYSYYNMQILGGTVELMSHRVRVSVAHRAGAVLNVVRTGRGGS